MPELVNINVGSLPGTRGLEATTVWPLDSKKSKNILRISATEATGVAVDKVVEVGVLIFWGNWVLAKADRQKG